MTATCGYHRPCCSSAPTYQPVCTKHPKNKTTTNKQRCHAPVTSPFALLMSSACLQVFPNTPSCVLSHSFPSAGCALDIPAPLLGSFSGLWHLQPYWAGLESPHPLPCGRDWAQRACVAQSIRESGRWDEQRCIPAKAACLLRRQYRDG